MSKLKELRLEKGLTQKQAAEAAGISLRSYQSYESVQAKQTSYKYQYIYDSLAKINPIDEDHGVLDIEYIRKKLNPILKAYNVKFCYLFGSYAKGKATPSSDVDLLVATSLSGLRFYGFVEDIRNILNKRVDVLDSEQLRDNYELTMEVLKDGVKIYG